MKITKRELKQMINESVYKALNEDDATQQTSQPDTNKAVQYLTNMITSCRAAKKKGQETVRVDGMEGVFTTLYLYLTGKSYPKEQTNGLLSQSNANK